MALLDESNQRRISRQRTLRGSSIGTPIAPIGYTEDAYQGTPTAVNNLASDVFTNQTGPVGPGGYAGMYTDPASNPNIAQAGNLWDMDYNWKDPQAGMGMLMKGMGLSTDLNSPFYQAMASLAPGLKYMSLFGGDSGNALAPEQWQENLQGWMSGSGGLGGYGGLRDVFSNIFNAPTVSHEAFLDTLNPGELIEMMGQTLGAGGYGRIAPELIGGLFSQNGYMANLLNQFQMQGGQTLSNLPEGTSQTDALRQFLLANGGADIMGMLGL